MICYTHRRGELSLRRTRAQSDEALRQTQKLFTSWKRGSHFLGISNHDYLHTYQIEAISEALKCFKIAVWYGLDIL